MTGTKILEIIGLRDGGEGARGLQPPRMFEIAIFGQKYVIFGQNHLMDKIFGQMTSALLN